MKLTILIFLLLSCIIPAQEREVSGNVSDSTTGSPLPYASILLGGTNKGTISNIDGEFKFKLDQGRYSLIIKYIGYRTDTLNILVPLKKKILIKMARQPVLLPEVLVTSENPAYRIIREAIKRKYINRKGLINYEYNSYLKDIVKSVGKIAIVQESILKTFRLKNKTAREFILATHRTENQKESFISNITATLTTEHLPDFSADTMNLIMNKVYLPIADNAFDYYDYKLIKIIQTNEAPVYEIRVIPLSQIQPLLEGTIYIEGKNYSIIKVDLKANKGLRLPYFHNLSVEFKQSLGIYDGYRLPDYFKMSGSFDFSFAGIIGVKPLSFYEVNSVSGYKINNPVPDSVLNAVRTTNGSFVADTSMKNKLPVEISSAEMKALRPVPLSKSEKTAYATIDTSMTFLQSVKFTGPLASYIPKNPGNNGHSGSSTFGKISELLLNYFYINNNRVENLSLGGRYNSDLSGDMFYTNSYAAYSTGMKKALGSLSIGYRLHNFFLSNVELEAFKKVQEWQPFNPYSQILNSASVFLGFGDQFNYYLSFGYRIGILEKNIRNFSVGLNFISDKESSLNEDKRISIFNSPKRPRKNPPINEGMNRKLRLSLSLGKSPFELQVIPTDGLVTDIELSQHYLKSDFNYFKFFLAGQLRLKTLYPELFLAPYLQINLEAGYVTGSYGIQHIFSPISAMGFYSPAASFKGLEPYRFVGDKMIALHIEHNWRTIIFQALGLNFLTNSDLDLITGAGVLRIFNNTGYLPQLTQRKPYWEVYAGISRILGIIKLNISYNSFNKFTATISAASIF